MAHKDPDRAREYNRKWKARQRAEHPEKVRARARADYEKHRERRLLNMAMYYEEHKDALREYGRNYMRARRKGGKNDGGGD